MDKSDVLWLGKLMLRILWKSFEFCLGTGECAQAESQPGFTSLTLYAEIVFQMLRSNEMN